MQRRGCSGLPAVRKLLWRRDVRARLHLYSGVWLKPQLRLHELRHLRLGTPIRLPAHDARLLGKPVPAGPAVGRALAHAVLHRHHLPGLLLPSELDPRYRRHVVRRVAEEGRGGRGSRRGGHQGEYKVQCSLKRQSGTSHGCDRDRATSTLGARLQQRSLDWLCPRFVYRKPKRPPLQKRREGWTAPPPTMPECMPLTRRRRRHMQRQRRRLRAASPSRLRVRFNLRRYLGRMEQSTGDA